MEREDALVYVFLAWVFFFGLCYGGACIGFINSVALSSMIIFIYLNIFYPVSNVAYTEPDYSLYLYGILQVVLLVIIFGYVILSSLWLKNI